MQRARVLVADDSPTVLELVTTLLADEFEVVATASDGAAALVAAIELEPDVIVLDVAMPAGTGLDVVAQLQSLSHPARVVLLSAHEEVEIWRRARAAGAIGYVVKRLAAADLIPALRSALAGRPFASQPVAIDDEAPPRGGESGA